MNDASELTTDLPLVGGGIMSATLGVLLRRMAPGLSLRMVECGAEAGRKASDGRHNAGTGHAGMCEIGYTPDRAPDGSVPVQRALAIFEQFGRSREFWSHLVESGIVPQASDFIHAVPRLCFVERDRDVAFPRASHAAMSGHPFFQGIRLATDAAEAGAWAPLVMKGRGPGPVAATRMNGGTKVDFGSLTRLLTGWLAGPERCDVLTGWRVTRLRREGGRWSASGRNPATGEGRAWPARFVFVGAGGDPCPSSRPPGCRGSRGLAGFPSGANGSCATTPRSRPGTAPRCAGPRRRRRPASARRTWTCVAWEAGNA